LTSLIEEALLEVSPDRRPFAGESLFNQIILKAWSRGALHSLDLSREEFSEVLIRKGWRYDAVRHRWLSAGEGVASGFQLTF